jgi:hypothetical protein
MEIKASVDDRALKALMKAFPKEILKAGQRLVNDMAFEFKAVAPAVIDKHMEVRNKSFVSRKPRWVFGLARAGRGPSPAFMKKRWTWRLSVLPGKGQ